MARVRGFLGDRLERNLSQYLKTFDIHRHVGLIENGGGNGAGLIAGRWLEASFRAVELSGEAFLRQRAWGMLDRILGSARGQGAPFPEMGREDEEALAGALQAAAKFWQNGPAQILAERLAERLAQRLAERGSGRQRLEAAAVVRITETERLAAVLPELQEMLTLTRDGIWGDAIEMLLWHQVPGCQTFEGDGFRVAAGFAGGPGELAGERVGAAGALMLARVPWMFYESEAGRVWVHQYGLSEALVGVGGKRVKIEQTSVFPGPEVVVRPGPGEYELRLRIPGWAEKVSLVLNGAEMPVAAERGYVGIARQWQAGDEVRLRVPAAPGWVRREDGEFAFWLGPLLYCVRWGEPLRVRRRGIEPVIVTPPEQPGPAYRLRMILESGREADARAEPFARSGWGGPYRTGMRWNKDTQWPNWKSITT